MIKHRLQTYLPDVYEWAFGRLREQCVTRKIRVFVVYRPATIDAAGLETTRRTLIIDAANNAGLDVIDLSSAFDQIEERNTLVLSPWDDHTNALGHKLLADKLYIELSKKLSRGQPSEITAGKVADQ